MNVFTFSNTALSLTVLLHFETCPLNYITLYSGGDVFISNHFVMLYKVYNSLHKLFFGYDISTLSTANDNALLLNIVTIYLNSI
jgi:hypothetical protein